tara:strand:+ start:2097 stop:2951 length:855 start_codon:yes stop_codon:yes gene_type:complete
MSWNGTVRCGNCYENGHNKTGCPELRKAWEADPDSYKGREWARIVARKKAPKTCGYCKETGHTRAGCADIKEHKEQFKSDAILFRKVIVKWMQEKGIGVGALVRSKDARYYDAEENYQYPGEENYVGPVGMVMNNVSSAVHHYSAIRDTSQHSSSESFLTMQTLGTASLPEYRRSVGLTLPCIPGIIPRVSMDWYGREADRADRLNHIDWEVVSAGQVEFDNCQWLTPTNIKQTVKDHFARDQEQESSDFRTFPVSQRSQLHDYVDGILNLSQMTDPELPNKDT